MTLRPIEIIGGGLAGLALGIGLRRAGVPVTLYEAGTYPRHRVCGEFITGLAASTLARLGIADVLSDALQHHEVAWAIGAAPTRIQRLPAPALGLSRYALDGRLADRFRALGGDLRERARVADCAAAEGRILATGRRPVTTARWVGLKCHVEGLELRRELEMHLGTRCYVGLARVEKQRVNVCGLFQRLGTRTRGADVLVEHLRGGDLGDLAARIAGARVCEESFCAVAGLAFDRRVAPAPDTIRLGDAGAMIPPFTGNGMAMAFQGAEAALDPVLAYARASNDWATACGITGRALRRRFRLRLASAAAVHSFLLKPRGQRWFAALGRNRLLPFGPLYAALH